MKTKYTCVAVDDNETSLVLLKNYIQKTQQLDLKATFTNALEAQNFLLRNEIDILFLDIEMPEMTGLELLKSLPKPPETILITSREEFALEAFDLDVVDYIVKPPEYQRFTRSVLRVIEILDIREDRQTLPQDTFSQDEFYLKVAGKYIRLDFTKISHIEALSDYVVVHTDEKRQYIVYSTLKAIEEKLIYQKHPFYRINRSYIVNTKKIETIEDGSVTLAGKIIPIGNTYKDDFMRKINKL